MRLYKTKLGIRFMSMGIVIRLPNAHLLKLRDLSGDSVIAMTRLFL